MKRVNRLLQFVLSLSLVTSCVESDEAVDLTSVPRQTITIEASQEVRRVETRTTLQTDGSVFWNPSDEISLFFNSGTNGGDKFVSQNTENVAIAEFSGSIHGITGGGENLEDNAYFWAVYPYSEGNSCDGSSVVTTLPYKQQAVEGTFADDLFITIARSPSVKMAFKNVCGGVKFCVSKSGIESVIFRGNGGENLAGKVRVAFDENNKPAVTEVIDGQSEIVVTAPNGGTFEPGKYYYIITLPTPLESGFEMTFKKSDNTKIVYKRTSGVVINRSRFGVVENVDSGEAVPDDTPTGGSESGFYLGIIGFNNGLYTYPIQHLSNRSIAGYNSFIDGLTTINGTLLYYAVDKSIDQLQAATFPSNLYDVSIVTFTDGLDRGSLDEGGYLSNTEYLAALNTRLTGEKVSDKSITAYSIGVKGDDVTNYTSFQNNLKNLATSNDNVFEVSNMSEVNEVFLKIADLLGETKYFQKLTLKIKGPSHNEKCRFTFDNASSYNSSQCYIEGTFNRIDKTLTDVKYVGLSSTSGTVVNSYKNEENFYVFTFEGVQASDGTLVPTNNVLHWYTEGGVWEKDSEFDFDPGDVSVEKIERSAAIILNLDCSSSLEGDAFATLQRHAKSFIAKLCENITDPYEAASISLNQTAVTMCVGANRTLSATVLPTTAVRKDVEYSSTNAAVASVDKNGKITAHKPGTATIIARTKYGGLTTVCHTTVAEGFEMVFVEGGTFTMGATSEQGSDAYDHESPTHSVTLSSYYIGKYEVTQAQWRAVMDSNPSYFTGDNLPVECVSWNDIQEFIAKLNAQTGKTFRLPTEAEWEYAARGGNQSKGYKYSGSNTADDVAWYNNNSSNKTHPVGQKTPNELGIYDMSGNVWEWCQDWSGSYSSDSQTNPTGPSSGSLRVLRGGSWDYDARHCRVSTRIINNPNLRRNDRGFRLVCSSE